MMARRLLCVAWQLLAGACLAVILTTPASSPERVAAALALIFVLPGLGVLEALPVRGIRGLGLLVLVPAVSLAVVILDSAALYVCNVQLGTRAWTVSLAAIAVVAAQLGILRSAGHVRWRWRGGRVRVAFGGLAAMIAGGVLLAAAVVATAGSASKQRRDDRYTQLWALPDPTGARAATVGIYNHEGAAQTYVLRAHETGRTLTISVTIGSGGTWSSRVSYPAGERSLRVNLSMNGNPAPVYRWVQLNLTPPR